MNDHTHHSKSSDAPEASSKARLKRKLSKLRKRKEFNELGTDTNLQGDRRVQES